MTKNISNDTGRFSSLFKISKVVPIQKFESNYNNNRPISLLSNTSKTFENLFLIGRNGMHRYNNMDHSMLTAMKAVENIKNGVKSKENIWNINAEEEYHEEK